MKPISPPPTRFPALDALRGVAVLMVVFDHMFAVAGERMAGGVFAPTAWVREWISAPLGIIQDFGWLGVCLFFLISGFVITHSARRESLRVFALRRAFRILPPLTVALAVVWVLDLYAGTHRPWMDYLYGLSLMGYFTVPQIVVLGVAWTLVIEVIFYMLMAAVLPLFKRPHPALGTAVVSVVTVGVILCARNFGDAFFLFAASVAYLPVLLIGSALYLHKTACASPLTVAVLILANCASFMLGLRSIHTAFLPLDNSYLLSLAYASGIFVVCVGMGAPKALRWVGDISYSLYLLHGTLGFFAVQQALALGLGAASPWVATVFCLGASYAMYLAVERPAIALGKRVSQPKPAQTNGMTPAST